MNAKDLKDKAITGSLWSMLEKFALQLVQLIVSIILARLLEPKDYGLIAIAMIFANISAAVTDGGFEKTLIRKKELSSVEINTVFYINVGLGVSITGLLIVTAPIIAGFFYAPAIAPVLQFMSLAVTINAFGQVQSILLRKELSFKKLSFAQIIASVLGGIIGIILAYVGWGVWALAISTMSTYLVLLLLYWINAPWYPKLEFSLKTIRPMLGYGFNVLFISVLFFAIQQVNTVIVGRFFSKTALGLFNRGNRFPDLIVNTVEGVIQKTAFPLFSILQNDNNLLSSSLEKSIRAVAFISFPLFTLLLVNAHDITITLFTEKWAGSIVFLQLFCIARFFHPLLGIYKEVILAKGYAGLLTRITLFSSILEIGIIFVVIQFGLIYIVIATFVSTLLQYCIYTFYTFKKMNRPWKSNLRWLTPCLLISFVTGLVNWLFNLLLSLTPLPILIKLLFSLSVGGITFLLIAFISNQQELEYIYKVLTSIRMRLQRNDSVKYFLKR